MQPNDTARKRAPMQPRLPRPCEVCGAMFLTSATNIAKGRGRFCGSACFFTTRRNRIEQRCEHCETTLYVHPARLASGRGRFCSKSCYDTAQREEAPVEVRLWERVQKDGPVPPHRPEYGNCWEWTGHRNRSGYGRLYRHFPDPILAHRLAWEIATGDVLTSDDVIGHVCDVRHCVRNDEIGTYTVNGVILPRRGHLFRGTNENNWNDMREKGRDRFVLGQYVKRGEAHQRARLTDEIVREIRTLYAGGGISQQALADRFSIDQTAISRVILRQTWKHVD